MTTFEDYAKCVSRPELVTSYSDDALDYLLDCAIECCIDGIEDAHEIRIAICNEQARRFNK